MDLIFFFFFLHQSQVKGTGAKQPRVTKPVSVQKTLNAIQDSSESGTALTREIKEYHPDVMTFITIILTVSGWTVRTYIMVHIISGYILTPEIKWRSRILRTMLLNVLFMIMEATLLPTGVGLVSLTMLKRHLYVTAVLPIFLTTTKTTITTSFICMTKTLQFCKIVQQTKITV